MHPHTDSPIHGWGLPDDEDAQLPLNTTSPALQASRVVKTGPGILYGFTVSSTKASAQFVQVFDAAVIPADGAVPLISKSVPAGDAVGFSWLPGRTFNVGIIICNSSTQGTKTLGSADCIFDAQFI
jgi:hypothetical protein